MAQSKTTTITINGAMPWLMLFLVTAGLGFLLKSCGSLTPEQCKEWCAPAPVYNYQARGLLVPAECTCWKPEDQGVG